MKLPSAEWTNRRGLDELIAALDGEARFVGGAVRDTLLELPVTDVDIATPLLPEEVMERLTATSIKVIPTGIAHGTVTAVLPDGPIEITTLRCDVSTDGRRATVAFSDDWKEDAARRDFTINALSADPETLEVFDYFEGLKDLENFRIRFIGSASERISEDYLRIMRYFRFLARFGQHKVDKAAFAACAAAAEKLQTLSRERVADELLKLLQTEDPRFAITKMLDAGIFEYTVEEIDENLRAVFSRLVEREQRLHIAPLAIRRLVALLPKQAEKANRVAKSLKLSKKQQKAIGERLLKIPGAEEKKDKVDPVNIRAFAYRTSVDCARDVALLFADESALSDMLAQLEEWQPPTFPITGGYLIERGLKPGPVVATTLARIEAAWIAHGFPDEKWLGKFIDNLEVIPLRRPGKPVGI